MYSFQQNKRNPRNILYGIYFMKYTLCTKNVRILEFCIINEECAQNSFKQHFNFFFVKSIIHLNLATCLIFFLKMIFNYYLLSKKKKYSACVLVSKFLMWNSLRKKSFKNLEFVINKCIYFLMHQILFKTIRLLNKSQIIFFNLFLFPTRQEIVLQPHAQ